MSQTLTSGHLKHYGDDYAENARGIYYANTLDAVGKSKLLSDSTDDFDYVYRKVLLERSTCIPSLAGRDWESPNEGADESER